MGHDPSGYYIRADNGQRMCRACRIEERREYDATRRNELRRRREAERRIAMVNEGRPTQKMRDALARYNRTPESIRAEAHKVWVRMNPEAARLLRAKEVERIHDEAHPDHRADRRPSDNECLTCRRQQKRVYAERAKEQARGG